MRAPSEIAGSYMPGTVEQVTIATQSAAKSYTQLPSPPASDSKWTRSQMFVERLTTAETEGAESTRTTTIQISESEFLEDSDPVVSKRMDKVENDFGLKHSDSGYDEWTYWPANGDHWYDGLPKKFEETVYFGNGDRNVVTQWKSRGGTGKQHVMVTRYEFEKPGAETSVLKSKTIWYYPTGYSNQKGSALDVRRVEFSSDDDYKMVFWYANGNAEVSFFEFFFSVIFSQFFVSIKIVH